MISIDDIKSLVQEWFSDCSNYIDVIKLYHEIVRECEIQSEYTCEQLMKGGME